MQALATEVASFRQWAAFRLSPDYKAESGSHGDAEWECDYLNWGDLYSGMELFLKEAADRSLAADEMELLLYMLARDNEDQFILEMLEEFPLVAMQVAQAALSYPDIDARWQAAVLLGRIQTPEAEPLLRRFLADDAEYVRRRAGFALEEREERK